MIHDFADEFQARAVAGPAELVNENIDPDLQADIVLRNINAPVQARPKNASSERRLKICCRNS
jgi:hypothetical protein